MSPQTRSLLRWIGLSFAALLVLVVLLLALAGEHLKHPLERLASRKLGVPVKIDGDVHARLLSFTPAISAQGISIGNPPWESRAALAGIERVHVEFKLLPLLRGRLIMHRLEIIRPQVYLHRDRQGRANWTRESEAPSNAPAGPPLRLPVIRDLLIESGRVTFIDEIRDTSVRSSLEAHQRLKPGSELPLRISGDGSFNGAPFTLRIAGAPLVHLNAGARYPFTVDLTAGDTKLQLAGALRRAFDFGTLEVRTEGSGRDLADLYHFLQVPIPNSPPYKISFELAREGSQVKVSKLSGTLGTSDIGGELAVDVSAKRPVVTGELRSQRVLARDLGAFLGGASAGSVGAGADNGRLFPDSHLQVERVRMADADLRYHAGALELGNLPMQDVTLHVRLTGGFLSVDPLELQLSQGQVAGVVRVDAREPLPVTHLDLRIKNLELAQLHGKAGDARPPLSGRAQGRIQLVGTGDSVHRTLGGAHGTVTVVVPRGEISSSFAELTGIDVADGLGLLLKGDDKRAAIRCGMADFQVDGGVMHARTFVVDTDNVHITARGDIRLGPEEYALEIEGDPKKPRIGRVRAPIELTGNLLEPHVGVRLEGAAKQGVVAAALGVIATPLAALLAFVDPGLAKDENCAALLATPEAQKTAPAAAPDGHP
ncbi:MAG TPA: AsmA family protein [Steroidobacteraceae bacterium]|nr:AsmA family protein [Steroidobacteraceae bacterium]